MTFLELLEAKSYGLIAKELGMSRNFLFNQARYRGFNQKTQQLLHDVYNIDIIDLQHNYPTSKKMNIKRTLSFDT